MIKNHYSNVLMPAVIISMLWLTHGHAIESVDKANNSRFTIDYSDSIALRSSTANQSSIAEAPAAAAPPEIFRPIVSRKAERLKRGLAMSTGPVDPLTTSSIRAGIFGSVAVPFGNLPASQRWNVIYSSLGGKFAKSCDSDKRCTSRARTLSAAIAASSNMGFMDKLRYINSTVNRTISYASDVDIYGKVDYWAKPSETIAQGRGDCEDYAILKMAALKAAGVPSSSMSIVVLRDRQRNLFHAVLAVTTDQGHFVLDNVHDQILNDRDISRYQPLYSLSQERAWIHGYRRNGGSQIASDFAFDRIAPGEGVSLQSARKSPHGH